MKVLVADDDPVLRKVLQGLLTRLGYEVILARDGEEARRILEGDDAPVLALLDWMMPFMDGVELTRWLRERNTEPYTYAILLTARDSREDVIRGLDAGADDYIVKPINVGELQVRIKAARRILDLQKELISAREDMRRLATRDALTGLLNRRTIMERLEMEIARALRSESWLSVLMCDIDHFKKVNDTWGHLAGDAILRDVSGRLSATLRPYDAVGRYGGEEFLVISPSSDPTAGEALAERLRDIIACKPSGYEDTSVPVTMSFGLVSVFKPKPSIPILREADELLYRAKAEGRNRVVAGTFAEPTSDR